MDAFPIQLSPGATMPRRLLGGIAVAVVALLCIWLLVAAGLQSRGTRDGILPGPMPDGPAIVQTDLAGSGVEVAPAPGADIAPLEGSVSPR